MQVTIIAVVKQRIRALKKQNQNQKINRKQKMAQK